MKTTMEELIDKIQYSIDVQSGVSLTETQVNTLKAVMLVAENLLEKEKEQIIDAGNACSIKTIVHREKLDEMSKDELRDSLVENTISYGQEYYNQTYNQNNL
jgi:peptide deformylase